MEDLSTPVGVVAVVGCALAVLALALAARTTSSLRRVRERQRVLLEGDGERDLVAHAAELQASMQALQDYVADVAAAFDTRLGAAEGRLDRAFAGLGVVRYDAYDDLAGRQSTTIALLDASRSGVVLSSLHHRDQARLYAKQVHEGRGEHELSPEEQEAVRLASS
jgi:hypothetical protein